MLFAFVTVNAASNEKVSRADDALNLGAPTT
jgi:hypothetical protein